MSAAEPVHPEPEPAAVPATVLAFRRPLRRELRVPIQPGPDPDLTPEQKLAATVEAAFAAHQRSLTDEDTALDLTITLGVVITMLNGAQEQNILGKEAFEKLHGMMQGMLAAPRLLA